MLVLGAMSIFLRVLIEIELKLSPYLLDLFSFHVSLNYIIHSVCGDSLDTAPRPADLSDTYEHHCSHFTAGVKTEAWGEDMAFPSPAS